MSKFKFLAGSTYVLGISSIFQKSRFKMGIPSSGCGCQYHHGSTGLCTP